MRISSIDLDSVLYVLLRPLLSVYLARSDGEVYETGHLRATNYVHFWTYVVDLICILVYAHLESLLVSAIETRRMFSQSTVGHKLYI